MKNRRSEKIVAGTNEPIVAVEVVVEVIEVEHPPPAIPVEVSHAAVTVIVEQNYAKYRPVHHPLNTLRVVFYSGPLARQYFAPSIFFFGFTKNTLPEAVAADTLILSNTRCGCLKPWPQA